MIIDSLIQTNSEREQLDLDYNNGIERLQNIYEDEMNKLKKEEEACKNKFESSKSKIIQEYYEKKEILNKKIDENLKKLKSQKFEFFDFLSNIELEKKSELNKIKVELNKKQVELNEKQVEFDNKKKELNEKKVEFEKKQKELSLLEQIKTSININKYDGPNEKENKETKNVENNFNLNSEEDKNGNDNSDFLGRKKLPF